MVNARLSDVTDLLGWIAGLLNLIRSGPDGELTIDWVPVVMLKALAGFGLFVWWDSRR